MMSKRHPNFDIIRLYDENDKIPEVIKVGILPFIKQTASGESFKMMVMKPHAEKEILGSPQLQIAKGTRQININGNWCDMREDDLRYADESFHEPQVTTALREGHEEIGLRPENIKTLYDMGGVTFVSASRGIKKPMRLFAAEIIDCSNFGVFEATTSETRWVTPDEFRAEGRADHVIIIDDIIKRLYAHINL